MSIQQFKKFDTSWKTSPVKTRGVKLLIPPSTIIDEFCKQYMACANWLSIEVYKELTTTSKPFWTLPKENGKPEKSPHTTLYKQYSEKFDQYGIEQAGQKRSIADLVLRSYKGFNERNGEGNHRAIYFGEKKAVHFRDWGMKNGQPNQVHTTLLNGEKHSFNYAIPKGMLPYKEFINWDTIGAGGNLIRKHAYYEFVTQAKIPFKWSYIPENSLGIDINKQSDCFIVRSDGKFYEHSELMLHWQKIIHSINKLIKQPGINSKKRQRLRIKWKKLHEKHRLIIEQSGIAEELIQFCVQNKTLLCIDNLTSGNTNSTFGQDKFGKYLIWLCEQQGIPFVVVPTPHTSQKCSHCDYVSKKNLNDKSFECTNCGFTQHRDINAAQNIADFGQKIWTDGIYEFWTWKKELPGLDSGLKKCVSYA